MRGDHYCIQKTTRLSRGSMDAISDEEKVKVKKFMRRLFCQRLRMERCTLVEAPLSKGSWIVEGKPEGIDWEKDSS